MSGFSSSDCIRFDPGVDGVESSDDGVGVEKTSSGEGLDVENSNLDDGDVVGKRELSIKIDEVVDGGSDTDSAA